MVRTLSVIVLVGFLFSVASTAAVDDILGTAWVIDGKLKTSLRGYERRVSPVEVLAEFGPGPYPWLRADDFFFTIPWEPTMHLKGVSHLRPDRSVSLDPSEGDFGIYSAASFSPWVAGHLARKLKVAELDELTVDFVDLVMTGHLVNRNGVDRMQVWWNGIQKYTGRSGHRTRTTLLKFSFKGEGGRD